MPNRWHWHGLSGLSQQVLRTNVCPIAGILHPTPKLEVQDLVILPNQQFQKNSRVSKPWYPCSSHQNRLGFMDVYPPKNGLNRYWSIPKWHCAVSKWVHSFYTGVLASWNAETLNPKASPIAWDWQQKLRLATGQYLPPSVAWSLENQAFAAFKNSEFTRQIQRLQGISWDFNPFNMVWIWSSLQVGWTSPL